MEGHVKFYFSKHYRQDIPLSLCAGAGKKYTKTSCLHIEQNDSRSFK